MGASVFFCTIMPRSSLVYSSKSIRSRRSIRAWNILWASVVANKNVTFLKSNSIVTGVIQRLEKATEDDAPRAIIFVENKERALEMEALFLKLARRTDLRVVVVYDKGIKVIILVESLEKLRQLIVEELTFSSYEPKKIRITNRLNIIFPNLMI